MQPSPKVAIVRFRRGMQQGLLGRISRSAVKEYHAFGIISYVLLSRALPRTLTTFDNREGTHAKYHYMICGVQGPLLPSALLQKRLPSPLLQVTSHGASSTTPLGPSGRVN